MPRILFAAMLAPTTAAAKQDAAIRLTALQCFAKHASKIRVIVVRIMLMRANVNHRVTRSLKPLPHRALTGQSVVIGADYNAHLLSPALSYRIWKASC